MKYILSIIALILALQVNAQKKVTFLAKDGLIVTADLYMSNDTLPWMVLCHQADYSRGEYLETAKKFNKLGYNCLAIDQRSGDQVNGVVNETAMLADAKRKKITYMDAEQDMIAAVDYAYKKSGKKVVLVGSSYSASLALKIAAENEKVKAVMAFSPGEYFENKLNVKDKIKNLDKPVFVTSSKEEASAVTALVKDIKSTIKTQFIPSTKGEHGSKALWKSSGNYHEYWMSIMMFVRQIK
jgi:dienelactone hydrolase